MIPYVYWQLWEGASDRRPDAPLPENYIEDSESAWEPFGFSNSRVAWRRRLVRRPWTKTEEEIIHLKSVWRSHAQTCRVCITGHALCAEGISIYATLQHEARTLADSIAPELP